MLEAFAYQMQRHHWEPPRRAEPHLWVDAREADNALVAYINGQQAWERENHRLLEQLVNYYRHAKHVCILDDKPKEQD